MKRLVGGVLTLMAVWLAPVVVAAQDAAAVTGVVSDASGAVIVGADVSLVNTTTKAAYSSRTNSLGSYTIVNVTPGPGYQLTFKMAGFGQVVVNDIYMTVATTRTQNATMKPGAVTTEVQVSAAHSEVTLNTTDATIGNNFDVKMLNDLPVQVRDTPEALFSQQPGITTIPGSDGGSSVTGARTDQTYVAVDGLDVNDISTGQSFIIVANAPVDSVQEFRGTVAGQLASAGPASGGQFQLVTKSGSNNWHGNLNEYHRDTSTVANGWFNDRDGVPQPHLVRNQFGGNIGGPIKRDKAFFFFNFYDLRLAHSEGIETTVPLDAFRNGNVAYINSNTDPATGQPCANTSRVNVNPTCISTLNAAQIKALDPANIGFSSTMQSFLISRYPHANDLTSGDGVNTGGYRFNSPSPDDETNYVGRVDFNINHAMKVFAKVGINRDDSVEFQQVLPSDPVYGNPFSDRSYNYVVGHRWILGANKVNEFNYGDTIEKFDFPANYAPTGTTVITIGDNASAPFMGNPYNEQESQKRRLPIPMFRDDFNWQRGSHSIGFGGSFKFIKTQSRQVSDFNFVGLGLGPALAGLDPSEEPADIENDPTGVAQVLFDNAFTAGLGHISEVSTSYNYNNKGVAYPNGTGHTRHYRYYQTELYFNDTWRITRNLALTYGLNYQYYSVPYETSGLESIQNFSFDKYFAARVQQSAAGNEGDSTVPFITYNLGGKANNAAPLYQPSHKDFAPRVAIAYAPGFAKGLVFNAGGGLVYDRTVLNALNFVQDQNSFLFQNSVENDLGDLQNDPRIGSNFTGFPANTPPVITEPYTPYVSGGTPYGLGEFTYNTIIDPKLKDPYSIALNGGIQQQLPWDMVLKVSYVGRLGRRLLAQADASQLLDFPDTTSGQLMSAAFANITQEKRSGQAVATPQPWFENQVFPGATKALYKSATFRPYIVNGDFADFVQLLSYFGLIDSNVGMASQFSENTFYTNKGFSSYNGLLTTLSKNLSHGLQFMVNYTWSHSMDNTSLIANQIASSSGVGFVCDVTRPRACRGNSDFDETHVINGDFTYELPFGRGKTFGATAPRWANEVIGGWTVAGIPSWHTGLAFTAFSNAFISGFANDDPALFIGNRSAVKPHVHKGSDGSVNLFASSTVADAAYVGPVGLQIGSRNNLRGPSAWGMDAGVGKKFATGERFNVNFRADAFNVFNHPTFALPAGTDITGDSGIPFGQINQTTGAARVLQMALRVEF